MNSDKKLMELINSIKREKSQLEFCVGYWENQIGCCESEVARRSTLRSINFAISTLDNILNNHLTIKN